MQSFKRFREIVLAGIVCLLTSGCSSYSEQFDCPIGKGLKCASLSEVNDKMDAGTLNLALSSQQEEGKCKDCLKVYWRSDLSDHLAVHHRLKGH